MTTFVAIYRGETVSSAKIVAISIDPALVADVSARLLQGEEQVKDPVLAALERGQRGALRLIRREARYASAR